MKSKTLLIPFLVLIVLAGIGYFGWSVYRKATTAASRNPVVPAFSADGAQLAVAVNKHTVIYDTAGFSPRLTLDEAAGGTESAIGFSPDRSTLMVDRGAWDTVTGERRYELGSIEAFRVAYPPDGSQIAVFSFDGLYIWDAATGAPIIHMQTASGCSCQTALAFSGNGQVVSAAIDGVKTWDIQTGELLGKWKRDGFSNAIAISADGKLLAVSEGTSVQLYDTASGEKIRDLDAPAGVVNLLAFSANDSRLAGDPAGSGAAVWDVESGRLLHSLAIPTKIAGLSFTADGSRLAAGGYDGKVRIYDDAGTLLNTLDFTDWGALLTASIR